MKIDLSGRASSVLCLAAIVFVVLPLVFFSFKAWLAEHWSESSNPALWRTVSRLEPDDAGYWRKLGLYSQWGMSGEGNEEVIRYLQRATLTDPRSAGLWMALADAYCASGDLIRAREAYEKAQADYPISAEVAWRYGSFFLYQGKFSEGFAEIKRAVMIQPSLAASAISECWQAEPDIAAILNQVVPRESQDYLAAIGFFLSKKRLDPALAAWNRLLALRLPIEMPQAIPLVNALIDEDRLADAQQTWKQALRATNWHRDPKDRGSLIFNGSFEHGIVNGGFGWRHDLVNDVALSMDSHVTHSGRRSLRIVFEGKTNVDFQNVFQLVPVHPRTYYHFSAYLRTQEVTTDHGIQFVIFDPRHPTQGQNLTPDLVGTHPWTWVQADFKTGPDTNVLEVALRRIPAAKFDNKIHGTVWVDDVTLVPARSEAKSTAR